LLLLSRYPNGDSFSSKASLSATKKYFECFVYISIVQSTKESTHKTRMDSKPPQDPPKGCDFVHQCFKQAESSYAEGFNKGADYASTAASTFAKVAGTAVGATIQVAKTLTGVVQENAPAVKETVNAEVHKLQEGFNERGVKGAAEVAVDELNAAWSSLVNRIVPQQPQPQQPQQQNYAKQQE